MTKVEYIDDASPKRFFAGSSCAFGVFDGLHKGHQYLIDCARQSAAASGGISVALTFSIDPDELFAPDRLMKLMTNEERIAALAASGVDLVGVLPFDREFASLSPLEFLEFAFGQGAPAFLHVGEGFRFGCRGSGDVAFLREWGAVHGMAVVAHDLLGMHGAPVSSTRIRKLLLSGNTAKAMELLGRNANDAIEAAL